MLGVEGNIRIPQRATLQVRSVMAVCDYAGEVEKVQASATCGLESYFLRLCYSCQVSGSVARNCCH